MIILGLLILIAAVVVGVAGVLTNADTAHALGGDFTVFGYHVTGSTGTLFLYGIAVGAVGMFGLAMLLGGARRTSRRGRAARRELERTQATQTPVTTDTGTGEGTGTGTGTAYSTAPTPPAGTARSWKHPFGGGHNATPRPSA